MASNDLVLIVDQDGIVEPEPFDAARDDDEWSYSMTRPKLLGVTATLSIAIATPVLAQAVVQEPDAYALSLPKAGAGIGTALPQRRDVPVVNHGTPDAMPTTPSVRLWRAGNETATRPWSRQPVFSTLILSRALIKKTRTSTAYSVAFAEAANSPIFERQQHSSAARLGIAAKEWGTQ
jgi:hypothetical protein